MKKLFIHKKIDNRGSSLFLVIMSILFVTLLASTVMAVALSNLTLKQMEKTSKKAFYTAETAVDEVYSSLGDCALQSVSNAYMNQLSNVVQMRQDNEASASPLTMEELNKKANVEMKTAFVNDYLKTLIGSAAPGTQTLNANGTYSVVYNEAALAVGDNDQLRLKAACDFVQSKITSTENLKITSIGGLLATTKEDNYCVELQDVVINYKSQAGYFSDITTNFLVEYPTIDVEFYNTNALDFLSYSLISDYDVSFGSYDKNNVGNATKAVASVGAGVYAADKINLFHGSDVTFKGGALSVAHDAINIRSSEGTADGTNTGASVLKVEDATLWSGGDVDLLSETNGSNVPSFITNTNSVLYVRDDLAFTADRGYASIAGRYYGYGNADNSDGKNASIIMNGRYGTLNMQASVLELLGRAYIDTDPNTTNSTVPDYENGESLNIKTNQSVYLVVDTYLKTNMVNPTGLVQLGGTADVNNLVDKDKILDTTNGFFARELLNQTQPAILAYDDSTKLYYAYYNFRSGEHKERFIEAIATGRLTTDTGAVIDVTADSSYVEAKRVFMDGMRKGFYQYSAGGSGNVGSITVNTAGSTINTLGPIYTYMDSASYALVSGNLDDTEARTKHDIHAANLRNLYGAMMSDTTDDSTQRVFTKIINYKLIGNTGAQVFSGTYTSTTSGITYQLLVTDEHDLNVTGKGITNGVIVHNGTGTVTVSADFNGLIISKGFIHVKNNATITTNQTDVENAIAVDEFYKYFKAKYTPEDSDDQSVQNLKYGDVIYITNWRKFED